MDFSRRREQQELRQEDRRGRVVFGKLERIQIETQGSLGRSDWMERWTLGMGLRMAGFPWRDSEAF